MNSFDRQLQFGRIGEGYIACWLRKEKGLNVLPAYEKEIHEGKGPVLFTAERETLIVPDLFCFRLKTEAETDILWIEAKTKSAFTWHRISERWCTGIDKRHYHDYLKVARLSPWPVWILFLHLAGEAKDTPEGMTSPTGLFGQSLFKLSRTINHESDRWGCSGMVYWAIDSLIKICELEVVLT